MDDALIPVARLDQLPPGTTKKFLLTRDGREIEAFVLRHRAGVVAYVNRCCHIPMTMDWVENQFLSDDGAHILCATHGALYEPVDGTCVAGPPLGQRLTAVPLQIRDGVILAGWPPGE
jgi:nitrite reductase/ring-hydroxylating ferredoxin subunit